MFTRKKYQTWSKAKTRFSPNTGGPKLFRSALVVLFAITTISSTTTVFMETADAADFASSLIETTKAEHKKYKGLHECADSKMSKRIGQYWDNVNHPHLDGCDTTQPWSAVFISMMMREAGAGSQFTYSTSHESYIRSAFAGQKTLYSKVSDARGHAAKPGDLVCKGRYTEDKDTSSWKYADFKRWYDRGAGWIPTHCDIVVASSGLKVTVIGGNVVHDVRASSRPISDFALVLPLSQPNGQLPAHAHRGQIVGKGGLCLDLPGQNTKNGTDLWMWDCNGTVAQKWSVGNGTFRVMEKCMDIEGFERKGSDVQITTCGYTGNLRWYVTQLGEIKSARLPHLCLDVRNGSTKRKARVQMWSCNGTAAQRWVIR